MLQFKDIPLFRGDGLQDAEKWQQDFVLATVGHGDVTVARLFLTKVARGSPASKHIATLSTTVKLSWVLLASVFEEVWLPDRRVDPAYEATWDKFKSHNLTDAMIFEDLPDGDVEIECRQRVTSWLEDHVRLGRLTGGSNEVMMSMTMAIIPAFIHSQLLLEPALFTFDTLCAAIGGCLQNIFEEYVRYRSAMEEPSRKASEEQERVKGEAMQKEEISEKCAESSQKEGGGMEKTDREKRDKAEWLEKELKRKKKSLMKKAREIEEESWRRERERREKEAAGSELRTSQNLDAGPSPGFEVLSRNGGAAARSEAGSIGWEPCSPLTDVASVMPYSDTAHEQQGSAVPKETAALKTPTAIHTSFNQARHEGTPLVDETRETDDQRWRRPDMTLTKEEQVSSAERAINSILRSLMGSYIFRDLDNQHWANVWSALVTFDRVSSCIEYRDKVKEALLKRCDPGVVQTCNPEHGHLLWGIVLAQGFLIVNDSRFKETAEGTWERYALRALQKDKTTANRYVKYNLDSIVLHQNSDGGTTLAGGLFEDNFGTEVDSLNTILYMVLSAYLSKCTGKDKYKEMAVLGATCIQSYMIDATTSMLKSCKVDAWSATLIDGGTLSIFLTGMFLEGVSVLASITGDDNWRQLAWRTANAVMDLKTWHQSNGILSPNPKTEDVHKGVLIRGLHEVHKLGPPNSETCIRIQRYINVQFNALLDLARAEDTYSADWTGSSTKPSTTGQMVALNVLVAAIGVNSA